MDGVEKRYDEVQKTPEVIRALEKKEKTCLVKKD